MSSKDLPAAYQDCVIKHADGSMRIARLNHKKTYWVLASYPTTTKHNYCWKTSEVVDWKEIEFNL